MATTTVDYTNYLTNVPNEYNTQKQYTDANYLAAPLRNIPSQHLPILPVPSKEDKDGRPPYDTLTKSSDQQGYYNVKSAYGDPLVMPQYYVGECPSNHKVMPFNTSFTPRKETANCPEPVDLVVEAYEPELEQLLQQLTDLEIILFVNPESCPYSRDALALLKQYPSIIHKSRIYNVNHPKSKQMFANFRGYATPYYYSLKTNMSHTGLISSLPHLHDKLGATHKKHVRSPPAPPARENYVHPDHQHKLKKLKDHQVVIVVTDCPYCKSYLNMLRQTGLIDHVKVINARHPDAPKNIHAVPYTMSSLTKKGKAGEMKSLDEVLHALS